MIFQPDGVYTTTEGWTWINTATYLQDSHPMSMKMKPHMHTQQSMIPQVFLEIPVLGMGCIHTKITRILGEFMNDTGNAPGKLRC